MPPQVSLYGPGRDLRAEDLSDLLWSIVMGCLSRSYQF
jgi:hypothetical protein